MQINDISSNFTMIKISKVQMWRKVMFQTLFIIDFELFLSYVL